MDTAWRQRHASRFETDGYRIYEKNKLCAFVHFGVSVRRIADLNSTCDDVVNVCECQTCYNVIGLWRS